MNITETVKVQYLGGVVVMNGDTVEAVIAFTGAQLRDLYFGKTVKSTLHLKIEDNAGDSETRFAVLAERVRGLEEARALQAREYERRLMELNNAHERAERALATGDSRYLNRELFDNTLKEWQVWRSSIDLEISKLSSVTLIAQALEDKVNLLISQVTTTTGRGQGLNQAWVYAIAAVTAAAGLTALINFFLK